MNLRSAVGGRHSEGASKRPSRRAAVLGLLVLLPAIATVALGIAARRATERASEPDGMPRRTSADVAVATFVGSDRCAACHEGEWRAWRESDHASAMRLANDASVAGDFDDTTYRYAGRTTSFRRSGEGYEVTTDGPDGELASFPVTFTFGVRPLQQYLVPFGGGRLQALPYAWDTRPRREGGQRWIHLYPDEETTFRDALHWTGPAQNWNASCAECHVTDFQKRYRPETRAYDTKYAELGVGCEACHGAASRHVAWATGATSPRASGERAPDPTAGFALRLGGDTFGWSFGAGPIASRRVALRDQAQLDTCGRCHARRTPIAGERVDGQPIEDTHRIALLEEGLYFADGQIDEEVYEYGSFVQSKMHARGVVCSNCHDPHAGAVRQSGNALCAQCHAATTFDRREHTIHTPGSEGSRCVDCHMPSRLYMRVDVRRDHSFRVPRPDLSSELGTPNACTASCHRGKSSTWAARAVERHYDAPNRPRHFGQAIAAGRAWAADARERLLDLVRDAAAPPIARATALTLLQRYPAQEVTAQAEHEARDADPLVRRASIMLLENAPPDVKRRTLAPLLADARRSVRIAAATALVGTAGMDANQELSLSRGLEEARMSLALDADRAYARVELANIEQRLGRPAAAERELRAALDLQATFVPAYVNLADLLRLGRRDDEALAWLERGLAALPDSATFHRAFGLALIRTARTKEALSHLARAAELAPGDPVATFVWAVALYDSGDRRGAVSVLTRAAARFPGHAATREALAAYGRQLNRPRDSRSSAEADP